MAELVVVAAGARIPWSASCFAVVSKQRCVAVEIAGAVAPYCLVVAAEKYPHADFALDDAPSPSFPSADADGAVTIDQDAVTPVVAAVVGKKNWSARVPCNREQSSMLSQSCCDLKSNRKSRSREL